MIWRSRVWMSLQIISRKVLHKHRASQSSRSQWLLYQRLTDANCGERRWLLQGLTRELSRTHESKDKKHGEPEEVFSSGRKLRWSLQPDCYWSIRLRAERALCSLCRPDECCAFFFFRGRDKLHLLLFAIYKENVEGWCKNLRAVLLILVFMTSDICQGPGCSQWFCNLSPAPPLGFGCLYLRTDTFWCSGVALVTLLGKSCERSPWGLIPHLVRYLQA